MTPDTRRHRFRLRLYRPKSKAAKQTRWLGLDFRSHIQEVEPGPLTDPVIASVIGEPIDYGHLFAYCFRRFGYPEQGWDCYKQLARWTLTTPSEDLLLSVVPYVGNNASISLRFLVPFPVARRVSAYDWCEREAWMERAFVHAQRQGLPDWLPAYVDLCRSIPQFTSGGTEDERWRALTLACVAPVTDDQSRALAGRARTFYMALLADYKAVEPCPESPERSPDVGSWADDDPLKPLAMAARIALADLRTPVGVRDQAIDVLGKVDLPRRSVKPAVASGYPCGGLGNRAPDAFAELHGAILRLGRGNAKRGIRKTLALIGQSSEKTP